MMAFQATRWVMLAITFLVVFVIINGCDRVEARISISEEEEEDLEFERQLRILNKPSIKTIKTEYGDVYNCVDIYKQPALDHPALKDHKIQIPKDYWSKVTMLRSNPNTFGLKKGCPIGTVPIRRTTKEELVRAKSISQTYAQYYGRKDQANARFEFAGFQTNEIPGRVYHGSAGRLNLYNPKVQGQEYSSSLISIESGPLNERNNIKVGWTVNPSLYGDNRTRLYTQWTKDNLKTTGCINTACSGFIHMHPDIPLDYVFAPVSDILGKQYEVKLGVHQQNTTKAWNFYFGEDDTLVGYWPPQLFSHLGSGANYISWGGLVYSPNINVHSPEMGSGVYADEKYSAACYYNGLNYTDAKYTPVYVDSHFIQRAESRCYYAADSPYKVGQWMYGFIFGGSGGAPDVCGAPNNLLA